MAERARISTGALFEDPTTFASHHSPLKTLEKLPPLSESSKALKKFSKVRSKHRGFFSQVFGRDSQGFEVCFSRTPLKGGTISVSSIIFIASFISCLIHLDLYSLIHIYCAFIEIIVSHLHHKASCTWWW